eukprot:m.97938 g.97938  ORF g.97938 m.97938 type:complete len:922 (-) comp13618_c1_seq2:66-2831(-)
MSFLQQADDPSAATRRFSLLLLDTAELYYEDFSVHYFPPGCVERDLVARPIKGRLLICSKSILFDPISHSDAILKFPYANCQRIARWEAPLMSPITGETIVIRTTRYVKLKEGNILGPYVFVNSKETLEFRFTPNYNTVSVVLSKPSRLLSAHKKSLRDSARIIDKITREHQESIEFDSGWLEDLSERIVSKMTANRVTPLVSNPGRVMLTSSRIYFQPFNNVDPVPVKKFNHDSIFRVVKRRYMLRQIGLEIFYNNETVLFLSFAETSERDTFYNGLIQQELVKPENKTQGNLLLQWQNGEISNYDYLMTLNTLADRSFNDLTQYPVFPWVIKDYTSEKLDLENPDSFRDLSKPIGALNEERLAGWKKRYQEMPEPKFLYGTHYSSPGYVLFYTVRVAPEYTLCLQNGKYDHADRMFWGMQETWNNVINGGADVKELIPEFYQPGGKFLENSLRLNLGTRQGTGERVDNVILPPWAGSASDFTAKCREALESDYVSANLHKWIDLIFGYKQRGQDAIEADNVFYHLTYEGSVDLDSVTDVVEREAIMAQIMEFGQTPKQLFTIPHPSRKGAARACSNNEEDSGPCVTDVGQDDAAESVQEEGSATQQEPQNAALNWANFGKLSPEFSQRMHREPVTAVAVSGNNKTLYSVGQDGCLKIHDLQDQMQTHSATVGTMALSSVIPLADGKTFIVGSWDNNVYWYDIEFGRVVTTLNAHDDAVSCVLRYEDFLVTSSWDSTIKIWNYEDAASGSKRFAEECMVEEMGQLDGEVHCMDIHEERKLIVGSGVTDGLVMVWNLSDYTVFKELYSHEEKVNDVKFSPDGQRVITCGTDATLRIFDIDHGTTVSQFELTEDFQTLAFDGQTVLAGCESGNLAVWDVVQGNQVAELKKHKGAVRAILILPDAKTVITGADDQTCCLWTLE